MDLINYAELGQRRKIVEWYGETADISDDEKVAAIFDDIRAQVYQLVKEGREQELMPRRVNETYQRKRLTRLMRVLGGDLIKRVAQDEDVLTPVITESVKYSLTRLSVISAENQNSPYS